MSTIKYGNTLTMVPFADMEEGFDFIVANPPYGTKWKGYEKEVKADKLGQFPAGLPSISDGQLLFMQHILWQLADDGIAVEVHNGSTLFRATLVAARATYANTSSTTTGWRLSYRCRNRSFSIQASTLTCGL